MQIYELGREMGADNKDIIRFLTENGVAVKNHMSALTDGHETLVREAIKNHQIDSAPPKVQPTKPWDASDNPWSRDMLRLKKKHEGFRCKWAAKGERLDRLLDIGWKIADTRDYGGVSDSLVGEDGKMDTTINRREMILVEIPEEMAHQRDTFYQKKANKRLQDAKNMASSEADKIERATGEQVLTEHRLTQTHA